MSENKNDNKMVIPGFKGSPNIELDINATKEAEQRFIEAKDVNPITYTDLEHAFNESYRELKRHHATVTYQIEMANRIVKQAKSTFLLDIYPDLFAESTKKAKENGVKLQDSAEYRESFLIRDEAYISALDRLAMLKAIESFIDGRIKVLENVSRYMRKRMDLIIRSGLTSDQLYSTIGNKSRK